MHGIEEVVGSIPSGVIPFADGHTRQLPKLMAGPFRYGCYAGAYVKAARAIATRPVKQAVIAPSAMSLLYPAEGVAGYPRERFIDDLVSEAEKDIRSCLANGAHNVQLDFTEGRLAVKLDPSKSLLRDFVALNNRVLKRFTSEERRRIGVHTCPGGDRDSTHSADVDYAELLPSLFEIDAGNFYVELAGEKDPKHALEAIKRSMTPSHRVFVGVIDVLDPGSLLQAPERP
jgi:5-methyltetrahydropteroyltriglutamate--homocysteine methyltransferase